MTADKLKQYVALFGGLLGAVLLFLDSLNVQFAWFNESSINGFTGVLQSSIPFVLIAYGVWKNTYIVTPKSQEQEEVLIKKGLK